jgi:Ser/Thr protein kinase RdoA (MazF antagonist)
VNHQEPFSDAELRSALNAYGLQPDSIAPYKLIGTFATAFLAQCGETSYLVRIRSAEATAAEIRYARKWALAVCMEVPVPVALASDSIPRIGGRCVEVQPYLPHDHSNGGAVAPEAWIKVGEWLGRMHRLGQPLAAEAPADLIYGNYPGTARVDRYFETAKLSVQGAYVELFERSHRVWQNASQKWNSFAPSLPAGVVHGDMHFWNVLYKEGMPAAVIDLDFLQRGVLLCDVAYACGWLAHWEKHSGAHWQGIMNRYIEAYGAGRNFPLSATEWEALPWARIRSSIFFFIQVASIDWEKTKNQMDDLLNAEALLAGRS